MAVEGRLPCGEINTVLIQICFRLSAAENLVQNIVQDVDRLSSSDLDHVQVKESLKLIAKCLQQTRGCINQRFSSARPFQGNAEVSASLESRIKIEGVPAIVEDVFISLDISDALQNGAVANGGTGAFAQLREQFSKLEPVETKDNVVIHSGGDARDLSGTDTCIDNPSCDTKEVLTEEIKVECNVEGSDISVEADADFHDDEDWSPVKQEPASSDRKRPTAEVEGKRECYICGKMVTIKSYSQHINLHEEKQRNGTDHPCTVCGKAFTMRVELLRHVYLHKDDLSVGSADSATVKRECEICGKMVNHGSPYYRHIRLHEEKQKDGRHHGCILCGKSFTMGVELKRHMAAHYEEDPSLLQQEVEGRGQEGGRKRRQLLPGEKKFSCPECGKQFSKKINLKLHKRIHGPRERILCQACGKSFLSPVSLKAHLQKGGCETTGDRTKSELSCKVCGKVVRNESNLRQHMVVHSEEKPYCCEVCGESFRRPYEINIHKVQRHDRPACDICHKTFNSVPFLKRHVQTVHFNERPFSCDTCGKTYKDKTSLKKHAIRHHNQLYAGCVKCDVCPKSFVSLSDLKKHHQRSHVVGKVDVLVK